MKEFINKIKMFMKDKEKRKFIVGISSLLFIGIIGFTFAIFNSQAVFENIFKTSKYDVGIDEEFYNEWGTKKVSFVNNDSTPVIIRIAYTEDWSIEEAGVITLLSTKIDGADVVTKNWTDAWKNDFVDGHDGWYYYKKVLGANSSVQVLESIELNEELIKNLPDYSKYLGNDYKLNFNFESIQATEKAVKNTWNKNITLNGDIVNWNF